MATAIRYRSALGSQPAAKALYRWLTFAEGVLFAGAVALYIWRWQAAHPISWVIFPIWLVASFAVHGDTLGTIGWRVDNLWAAARQGLLVFGAFFGGVLLSGVFLGALQRLPAHLSDPRRFIGYLSFCLVQQIALNSYLMNRFVYALESRWAAALLCSVVFAGLHWPNPVLVPLTLVGGFAMCWLFERERNILPLTMGQAILGGLVWWAFPVAWHHSMRVGPGYSNFVPKLW